MIDMPSSMADALMKSFAGAPFVVCIPQEGGGVMVLNAPGNVVEMQRNPRYAPLLSPNTPSQVRMTFLIAGVVQLVEEARMSA